MNQMNAHITYVGRPVESNGLQDSLRAAIDENAIQGIALTPCDPLHTAALTSVELNALNGQDSLVGLSRFYELVAQSTQSQPQNITVPIGKIFFGRGSATMELPPGVQRQILDERKVVLAAAAKAFGPIFPSRHKIRPNINIATYALVDGLSDPERSHIINETQRHFRGWEWPQTLNLGRLVVDIAFGS